MREMAVILLGTNDSFLPPSSLLPLCVCVCVSLSLSLSRVFQCLNNNHLKAHINYILTTTTSSLLLQNINEKFMLSEFSRSVISVVCYLVFVGACVAPEFVGPDSVSVLSSRLGKPAFRHVCLLLSGEFVNSFCQ